MNTNTITLLAKTTTSGTVSGVVYTTAYIDSLISGYQKSLVAGDNIATIFGKDPISSKSIIALSEVNSNDDKMPPTSKAIFDELAKRDAANANLYETKSDFNSKRGSVRLLKDGAAATFALTSEALALYSLIVICGTITGIRFSAAIPEEALASGASVPVCASYGNVIVNSEISFSSANSLVTAAAGKKLTISASSTVEDSATIITDAYGLFGSAAA